MLRQLFGNDVVGFIIDDKANQDKGDSAVPADRIQMLNLMWMDGFNRKGRT